VKKLLLAGIAASMVYTIAARAADDDPPPPPSRFRPWQQVWQCNDIRVTGTRPLQHRVRPWWYDLGRWPLHRDQRRSLLQRATLSTIATGRLLMKKLLPIGIAALSVLSASAARAEEAEAGHLVAALNTPEDVSSLGNPEG